MHVFWQKKKLVLLKIRATFFTRVMAKWSENRAAQGFHYKNLFISNLLDPIPKLAPARSVQLEALYLEALLHLILAWNWNKGLTWRFSLYQALNSWKLFFFNLHRALVQYRDSFFCRIMQILAKSFGISYTACHKWINFIGTFDTQHTM